MGFRLLVGAAVTALVVPIASISSQAPPPGAAGRRLALLVGVTEFIAPAMKKHNLDGPANDARLFRGVLESDAFGVPANAIVSLAGLPDDESKRPTRANIEREFRRLIDLARAGDQVVVLLAGHGSQQPANDDPADEEPDGLDEIFLPADASGWDGTTGRVRNAIVDDELRQWTVELRNKGAAVWLIIDACHAGTMSRAGRSSRERERGIPAGELVPVAAIEAARRKAAPVAASDARHVFELSDSAADIAALYAANAIEGTPELAMPDRNGPVHGLFTYTLASVLAQRTAPLTYRELVQRVIDRYRAEGFAPTPAFEGAGVDRDVLGDRASHNRPPFRIAARAEGGWTLDAGSIYGLTRGSVLEVFPPADAANAATSTGHVRIATVTPTTALVVPVAFAGRSAPSADRLAPGSRAQVKYHEFGDLRLRVALQEVVRQAGQVAASYAIVPRGRGPRRVEQVLDAQSDLSQGLAERVSTDADWFVRVSGTRLILVPSSDWRLGAEGSGRAAASDTPKSFDVGALSDGDLPHLLADRLRRIGRAANIARLSSYIDRDAGLQVRVIRYAIGSSAGRPLLADSSDGSVRAGERLEFVLKNSGTVPLDVTLLYIDAHFGITPLFPEADRALDNRIDPGAERPVGPVEINANPIGWESVVAIGVESTLRHENFTTLAQPSLTRGPLDPPPSPLRKLLETALYGTAGARRGADDALGRFAINMASFRVELPSR